MRAIGPVACHLSGGMDSSSIVCLAAELQAGPHPPASDLIAVSAVYRETASCNEEQYVEDRPPLSLGGVQSLPVPGRLGLGPARQHELELHPADGHTADGTAFFVPWLGVLVCGDYLSPVEIPWISPGGSAEAYLATLDRLRALVERVETVVPGHGRPLPPDEALAVLEEDAAYLRALIEQGAGAALPAGRRTKAQRRIHEQNVATRRPS